MRLSTAAVVVLLLALTVACATTPAPPRKEGDFSYLRTPSDFQSYASPDGSYKTAYVSPADWPEQSARNSFNYWNAVMAVRTGNRCFVLQDLKVARTEEIGTGNLNPGSAAGPTSPGAPLMTRPPVSHYQMTAVTKFDPDCTQPGAIDARDYLTRTNHPERAPRR